MILDSKAVQAAMLRREIGVMELSKQARIPPKTVSAAHKRDITVTLPTVARLARALEVEPPCLIKYVS